MPPRECQYSTLAAEDTANKHVARSSSLVRANMNTEEPAAKKKPLLLDFLIVFVILLYVTTYVESNAGKHHLMLSKHSEAPIPDIGFELTADMYEILKNNRGLNDALAFVNSLALLIPLAYSIYITTWVGDWSLIFRIVASQVLRSICGWFTHLPPDATYLASNYDYPDIINCMSQQCSSEPEVMPFISFFSGHVTNMVIAGNDMWLRDMKRCSLLAHALNVFQIVRMLATRGHYTIDIIMGWIVAVYFSNGAARLGRYYTQGMTLFELVPKSITQVFDMVTGISQVRADAKESSFSIEDILIRNKDEQLHSSEERPKFFREFSISMDYSSASSTSSSSGS